MRALDIAFASPAARIKIEFQGGEPLLNFPLIKNHRCRGQSDGTALGKKVDFVIASNLALVGRRRSRLLQGEQRSALDVPRRPSRSAQQEPSTTGRKQS